MSKDRTWGYYGIGEAGQACLGLMDWIDELDGLSVRLEPILTVGYGFTTVTIGNIMVWSTEEDGRHECTVEFCKEALKEHIRDLLPYLESESLQGGQFAVDCPIVGSGGFLSSETRPALLYRDDGLRVILGAKKLADDVPDIRIERRQNGWLIFVHPIAESDPSGYLAILDSGMSYWSPEASPGGPVTEILHADQQIPGLDG